MDLSLVTDWAVVQPRPERFAAGRVTRPAQYMGFLPLGPPSFIHSVRPGDYLLCDEYGKLVGIVDALPFRRDYEPSSGYTVELTRQEDADGAGAGD